MNIDIDDYVLDIFQYLNDTLSQRIMILDGPMGTMIQQHSLDEDAFRGITNVQYFSNSLSKLLHFFPRKFCRKVENSLSTTHHIQSFKSI